MDPNDPDAQKGLYQKYAVYKIIDAGGDELTEKRETAFTFTLVPERDFHALAALRGYAELVRPDFPILADDLRRKCDEIEKEHYSS